MALVLRQLETCMKAENDGSYSFLVIEVGYRSLSFVGYNNLLRGEVFHSKENL